MYLVLRVICLLPSLPHSWRVSELIRWSDQLYTHNLLHHLSLLQVSTKMLRWEIQQTSLPGGIFDFVIQEFTRSMFTCECEQFHQFQTKILEECADRWNQNLTKEIQSICRISLNLLLNKLTSYLKYLLIILCEPGSI